MRIEFVTADTQAGANAALAVLAYEAAALSPEAKAVNEATGGAWPARSPADGSPAPRARPWTWSRLRAWKPPACCWSASTATAPSSPRPSRSPPATPSRP